MHINTMDYNIFNDDKTNIKYIKFGKIQTFNNRKYIPIYYNDTRLKQKNYNSFLIKTPRLFIPNKARRETGFKPSIEVIMIKGDDNGVEIFTNIIKKIEIKIKNQIKKRKRLNLKDKEYIPLIREDIKYKTNKFYLPLNIFTSSCIDINNKNIKEWKFTAPTYGYFIILIKNIWISDNKWGINIFCNGAMILPSQLMDPPPIPVQELKYMFGPEIDSIKTVGDSEEYKRFFKMKKMCVPIQAIKNKMELEGLNPDIINFKPETPLSKIKEISSGSKYPPPPPLPPPLLLNGNKSLIKKQSQSSNGSIHSALFNELLNKKITLKANTKRPIKKNITKKIDNRVPSLDQIKQAISRMKSFSTSSC